MDCKLRVDTVDVENWIVGRIAELINVDPDAVSRNVQFDTYGIDSAKAIALIVDLEEWLQLDDELPLELLFEAESIQDAAENIIAAIAMPECGSQALGGIA
jgi:acyl carrier protein